MIISASRRTDIPACFSDWFYNRIKEGIVKTRNPFNFYQVNQVNLNPEDITCIVFWTKNAEPMISRLELISEYNYYFQYTLTAYPKAFEPNLPSLEERINTFIHLSKIIGRDRIIWRYDPILLTPDIDIRFHEKMFMEIARFLSKYTFRCIISFIDMYNTTKKNTEGLNIIETSDMQNRSVAEALVPIARHYDLELHTCSERINLEDLGISHGRCIDDKLISKLTKTNYKGSKDPSQREECGCIKSFDIGVYNTCHNGCRYCYATRSYATARKNQSLHNPNSAFLLGEATPRDNVKNRYVDKQMYLKL